MQYTLRRIPLALDQALRHQAARDGISLNEATLKALAHGLGLTDEPQRRRDLQDLAGSWTEDSAFDEVIADHRRIDDELWR